MIICFLKKNKKNPHTHRDSSFQSVLLARNPLNDARVVFFLWGFKCYLACLQWNKVIKTNAFILFLRSVFAERCIILRCLFSLSFFSQALGTCRVKPP